MTEEAPPVALPSLDDAIARRDDLVRFFNEEVPRLRSELDQLIGYIAGKSETNGHAEVVTHEPEQLDSVKELKRQPNRATRRAK